jgi:hypothetical protein
MTSPIMKKMTKGKGEQKINNIMSQWGSVLQIQIGLKGLQIVMPIPAPYWTVVYSVYETFSTLTPFFGGLSLFDELSNFLTYSQLF